MHFSVGMLSFPIIKGGKRGGIIKVPKTHTHTQRPGARLLLKTGRREKGAVEALGAAEEGSLGRKQAPERQRACAEGSMGGGGVLTWGTAGARPACCPTSSPFPALSEEGRGRGGGPGRFRRVGVAETRWGKPARNCHTMPLYQEFPGPGWGWRRGAEGGGGRLSPWGPCLAPPPAQVCPPSSAAASPDWGRGRRAGGAAF